MKTSQLMIYNEIQNILINMEIEGKFPNDLKLAYIAEQAEKKLDGNIEFNRIRQIENASLYLCEGELSIEEQYKILEEFDGDDFTLLSNIDGILVWNHLEDSLTVSGFFESI